MYWRNFSIGIDKYQGWKTCVPMLAQAGIQSDLPGFPLKACGNDGLAACVSVSTVINKLPTESRDLLDSHINNLHLLLPGKGPEIFSLDP